MRNYERLEELPGTIVAGLQAGEIVLAVDRLLTGEDLGDDERTALNIGGDLLRQLADPTPIRGPRGRRVQQLISAGSALDALEAVHASSPDKDLPTFAIWMATAVEHAATGHVSEQDKGPLEAALKLFSRLGDYELARVNGIVRTREEPTRWASSMMTSRF
jgi:hypothetical protein